jgi:hypothetical protein
VRALYAALRICNERIYVISRFHDLTFGHAIACNHRRVSVGHLATRIGGAVGFGFGHSRIVAHVQQRDEAKHFILG